jgi:hypothetical protein
MLQDQSKLSYSIDQYQLTAEDLEAELVKAFHKLSKKTGMKLWKPLNSLQSKDDVPKLDDVVKEVHENVEKLRKFDDKEKSNSRWDKVKGGISKFVKCTLPALKNFLMATTGAESVSEHEKV